MARVTCGECGWWERVDGRGVCHRYPPTAVPLMNVASHPSGPEHTYDVWRELPMTLPEGWCGEAKKAVP